MVLFTLILSPSPEDIRLELNLFTLSLLFLFFPGPSSSPVAATAFKVSA